MILRYSIFIAIFLIVLNLIWTIFSLDSAPLIKWSNEILTSETDKWALRGQIGDIMSGHFSALAFLAVALSIIFQYEANKQMRESIEKQETAIQQTKKSIEQQTEANLEQAKSTLQQAQAIELQAKSIEQQNEALKVQSETLKAQIEELTESRKESEKQTEEFFIQNMNVKLDRYYSLLTKLILDSSENIATLYINKETDISNLLRTYQSGSITELKQMGREDLIKIINKHSELLESHRHKISSILQTTKLIYEEISNLKNKYNSAYIQFLNELALRIQSERVFYNIYETPLVSMDLSAEEVKPLELLDTPVEQFISNIKED